jgi:hypothetical protein
MRRQGDRVQEASMLHRLATPLLVLALPLVVSADAPRPSLVLETPSPTPVAGSGRWLHAVAMLPDGRLVVLGGQTENGNSAASTTGAVEIYDPATGRWSDGAPMPGTNPVGEYTTIATLPGDVFVLGLGWANRSAGMYHHLLMLVLGSGPLGATTDDRRGISDDELATVSAQAQLAPADRN